MRSNVCSVPQPRTAVARWLSSPILHADSEADAELRIGMFRRMESVLASAVTTLVIVILAAIHHPTLPLRMWLAAECTLFLVRAPLAIHIIRVMNRARARSLPSWTVDLFIFAGTIWSGTLGFGCLTMLATQDPGLSFLGGLLAMGTIGGQCARSPSSPRLNMLQMCLVIVPFLMGAFLSDIPMVRWAIVISPLYLVGMLNVTMQLHQDHVAMIVARIENRRRALHCSLTGLPNRAFFDEALERRLDQAFAAQGEIVVLCLDLDGFKAVNDEFGHPMGDVLLRQVADHLRGLTQPGDMVARLGGDEFAILLGSGGTDTAEALATRIVVALSRPFALTAQHTAKIGVSVGIAGMNGNADETAAARLMSWADDALYAAKRAGRGTFRHFAGEVAALAAPSVRSRRAA